jgi:hypothetical protein
MNKYQSMVIMKLLHSFIVCLLIILPSWAMATGVRIYNPFSDPIAIHYQICNKEEESCRPSKIKLIYSKTEAYLRLNRYDCVVFLHVNTLEGRYALKTYNNNPCKVDMGGIDHVEAGMTFYVPEQYYNYQMLCQIEVTGPPRSFIIR